MEFLKNPFKVKFLPVLFALLVGVMLLALTPDVGHKVVAALCWGFIALTQVVAAGKPLNKFSFWAFLMMGSFFGAFSVMSIFLHAYLGAVLTAAFAALPISIVYTRPVKE